MSRESSYDLERERKWEGKFLRSPSKERRRRKEDRTINNLKKILGDPKSDKIYAKRQARDMSPERRLKESSDIAEFKRINK